MSHQWFFLGQNATDIRWFPLAKVCIFFPIWIEFFPIYKNKKKIIKINKLCKLNNNANKIWTINFFPPQLDNLRTFHYEGLGFSRGLSNEIITSAVSALKKKVACVAENCLTIRSTTDRRLKRKMWKGYQRSVPSSNRIRMLVTMKNVKILLKVKLKKCLMDLQRKTLKLWPHRRSASRTFSLQQFQPKEEDTKVSYSDTVTLQSFDQRKFSA